MRGHFGSCLVVAGLLAFVPVGSAIAWDNVFTHPSIMKVAARSSDIETWAPGIVALVGSAAKPDGLETIVAGTSIVDWLRAGGNYEDRRDGGGSYKCWSKLIAPRVVAHFHDPTKAWASAGLTDLPLLDQLGLKIGGGPSALLWATQDDQQICGQNNDWTWRKAREHLHAALTKASPVTRDLELGLALRAVGQVAHLLQDMAVPAHVRNDAHALAAVSEGKIGFNMESWAAQAVDDCGGTLCVNGVPLSPEAVLPDPTVIATYGIAGLWDTTKLQAGALPSASVAQGLAEYTSSNFLSRHTIFYGYEAPSPSGTKIVLGPLVDGEPHVRCAKTDGDPVDVLVWGRRAALIDAAAAWRGKAATSLVQSDLDATVANIASGLAVPCVDPTRPPQGPWDTSWELDPGSYPSHARMLLPRAVGYSRALLNYFVRGKLAAERIAADKIRVRNLSTEDMGGTASSTLTVYSDDASGTRQALGSASNVTLKGGGDPVEIAIAAPKDASSFVVVFRGRLGLEDDAVVAQRLAGQYQMVFLDGGLGPTGINNWSTVVGMSKQLTPLSWRPSSYAPEAIDGLPTDGFVVDIDDHSNLVGYVPGPASDCKLSGTTLSCPSLPYLWNLESKLSLALSTGGHFASAPVSIDRQGRICGGIADETGAMVGRLTWDGATGAIVSPDSWTCSTGAKTKNSHGQTITSTTLFDGSLTHNWTDLVTFDPGTKLSTVAINDLGQVIGRVCCYTTALPNGGTESSSKAVLILPPDSDGDRVADTVETMLGTNASSPDSDGDGVTDGDEIARGTDPLDPQSK